MKRSFHRAATLTATLGLFLYGVVACTDDDTATPATSTGTDAGSSGTTSSSSSGGLDSGGSTDSGSESDAGPMKVTLKFKAKVGDQDFKCGTSYPAQGTKNDTVEPRDLRFFVQDVKLIDSADKEVPLTIEERSPWQTPEVALLDFENGTGRCSNGNAELNDTITGTVPAGTYKGIVFSNGVPASVNHLDPATAKAPLTAGGMTWGWLLGHIFIKAEVASTTSDGGLGLLHLGSTGCSNDAGAGGGDDQMKGPTSPCKNSNRNVVKLTGFDPAKNAVVFDVKPLFAGTDLSQTSMCHSMGPACPSPFTSVGVDYAAGTALATAPVYRVE